MIYSVMRTKTALSIVGAAILSVAAKDHPRPVPEQSKVFIAAMDGGLDGFVATEVVKQKIPLIVVTDERDADYVLSGASLKADDKWYNVVFGGKDKNEGNVRLLAVKDKRMVWAGEAGDRSMWFGGFKRGGERKVAARIVSRMKTDLFEK
jgi:hypothetical protein